MFKKLLFSLLLLNQFYISLCEYPSFEQYCLDFNKVYTEPEKSERKKIYEENLAEMQQIHEYQTAVNFYTDHRDDELPSIYFYYFRGTLTGIRRNVSGILI